MKYRIFSVLMVLAMVASLCVVAAAPASADSPDVTIDNIVLGTMKAGANNVSCDITVQAVDPIDATDVITFSFGSGFDMSDIAIDDVDGNELKYYRWNGARVPDGNIQVSGNDIILTVPTAVGAGGFGTFKMSNSAGLGNPNVSMETDGGCPDTAAVCVSGTYCADAAPETLYKITANGDAETVQIYDYVKVDGANFAAGDTATITGIGFSPNATLHVTGGFNGSGVVGSDGTVEITAQVNSSETPLFAADTTGRKACLSWAGNFNLLPTLKVTPGDGPVCTPLVIEGSNYPVGTLTPDITIGGNPLVAGGMALTDLDGDNQADDFRVIGVGVPPTLGSGQYQIVAGQGSTWFDVDSKTVAVSPAAGPPGTAVTLEGNGFCPTDNAAGCEGYAILMYGNTTQGGPVVTIPIQVDDQGSFVAAGHIPDNATDGLHGIVVFFNPNNPTPGGFDATNPNQVSAQGTFMVTDREILLVPNNIPFGTTVTLSGGDFGSDAKNMTPALFVNYVQRGLGSIDNQRLSSSGDLVPVTFKISNNLGFHYGDNVVEIKVDLEQNINGHPSQGVYDMVSATVLSVDRPTLTIDPSMGPRGTKVTAEGSGWLTGKTDFVTIVYERTDSPGENTFAIASANADGDIWTQFDVPPMDMNNDEIGLLIHARDGSGNTSLVNIYTVTVPTVTVEPKSAAPGDDVTVTGSGFRPKNQVQEVSIGGAPIVPVYELGLTDSKGSFRVEGTVPGVMEGGQIVEVRVTENEGDGITVPFTVIGSGGGDVTVEEGFDTIAGKYTKVWTFNANTQGWEVFDTTEGAPDDFTILNSGQGYWVEVTEDCTLTYGANTWNMKKGWNLIGWLG